MLYLHELASRADWRFEGAIERDEASMPTCAPYTEVFATYVSENGGQDSNSDILSDVNNFLKAFDCNENGGPSA